MLQGSAKFQLVTSKRASLNLSDRYTWAPVSDLEKNDFVGCSANDVYDVFMELIAPFDDRLSCWAMHCFVILDAQSVKDRTCLLVSDADGKLEFRRSEFAVALYHLRPLEALKLGVSDLDARENPPDQPEEVLTEAMARTELRQWNERKLQTVPPDWKERAQTRQLAEYTPEESNRKVREEKGIGGFTTESQYPAKSIVIAVVDEKDEMEMQGEMDHSYGGHNQS